MACLVFALSMNQLVGVSLCEWGGCHTIRCWMVFAGSAILGVMGFHFASPTFTGGAFGVDVFFVLSGYLITSILVLEIEATGHIDYWAFLLRRIKRLIPALLTLLVIYLVVAPWLFPEVANRRWLDVGTALFYITNLRQAFWPADNPLSPTWSLAIEEQFYVLWPFLLVPIIRLGREKAMVLLFTSWVFITLARFAWSLLWPDSWLPYYFTPFHATGLIAGAWLAFSRTRLSSGAIPTGILIVLMVFGHSHQSYTTIAPVAELVTVAIIAGRPEFLGIAPLRNLGRVSYGIYLWHIPVLWALVYRAKFEHLLPLVSVSIAAGTASYFLVERWFLVPAKADLSLQPSSYPAEIGKPFR